MGGIDADRWALGFSAVTRLRCEGGKKITVSLDHVALFDKDWGLESEPELENLIKLRGRWLWFGSPAYGDILDRDEYFDAEISTDLKKFINVCGLTLTGLDGKNQAACFAENFKLNGLQHPQIQELLQPLWEGDREAKIHITKATESGDDGLLQGYIENSLIGTISLPPGMKIVKHKNRWQWSGNSYE